MNKINFIDMEYLKKIFSLLQDDKKKIPVLLLFFITSSILEVLTLSFIGIILDFIFNNNNSNKLIVFINENFFIDYFFNNFVLFLCYILITLIAVKSFFVIFVEYSIQKFSLNRQQHLRLLIVKNFFNSNYLNIMNRNSSELLAAINLYVGKYSRVIISCLAIIRDILVATSIFVVLFYVDKKMLFILMIALFIIFLFYNYFLIKKTKLYGIYLNESVQSLFKSLNESIDGIKEIKNFGIESFFISKFRKLSTIITKNSLKLILITTSPRHLLELLFVGTIVFYLIFSYGINNNLNDIIPAIGVFFFGSLRIIPILNQLFNNLVLIRTNYDTVNKLYKDTKKIEIDFNNKDSLNIAKFDSLEFKDVSFNYSNTKHILQNLSIKINKGESIGIFGNSGTGKSTLLNVLMGFLDKTGGQVFLNSKEVSNYPNLIRNISVYLSQKPFLIDDDILSNIALGEDIKKIDMQKINKALNISKLNELYDNKSDVLSLQVGENGNKISFGQKQRIIIARAIYFERELIIMDESTSSLDKTSEKEIFNALNEFKSDFTFIIVSHNENVMKYCNKVYKLESGKLKQILN